MMKYRTRKLQAIIPTASMADIAFLLITFFMYTTSFSVDRTEVELPESVVRQMVEKDAAIIAITMQDQIYISDGIRDSAPVSSPEALEQDVRQIIATHPGRQFIVKCDRNTKYQTFNQIYEILIKASAQNVALLTEKKSEGK